MAGKKNKEPSEVTDEPVKKPKTKITIITIMNWLQKPPGIPTRKSLTTSSPPKPLKAAVNIVAPSSIIKTNDVVLAVSSITPLRVSSIFKTLHALQKIAINNPKVPIKAKITPTTSELDCIDLIFTVYIDVTIPIKIIEAIASIDG